MVCQEAFTLKNMSERVTFMVEKADKAVRENNIDCSTMKLEMFNIDMWNRLKYSEVQEEILMEGDMVL